MNTKESLNAPRSDKVEDVLSDNDVFFECHSPTHFGEPLNQPEPAQRSEHEQPENQSQVSELYSGDREQPVERATPLPEMDVLLVDDRSPHEAHPQGEGTLSQAPGPHQQGPNPQEPSLLRPAHEQINDLERELENLTSKLEEISNLLREQRNKSEALESDGFDHRIDLMRLKQNFKCLSKNKMKYKNMFRSSKGSFREMLDSHKLLREEREKLKEELKEMTASNAEMSSKLKSQRRIIKNLKKKKREEQLQNFYNTVFSQPTDREASTSEQKSEELDSFKEESQDLAEENKIDIVPESQPGVSGVPGVKEEEASESVEQEQEMDPEHVEERRPEPTSERELETVPEGLTEQTVEPQPDTASTKDQEPTSELMEDAPQPKGLSESRKCKQKTKHLRQTDEEPEEEEKTEDPKEVEAPELIDQEKEVDPEVMEENEPEPRSGEQELFQEEVTEQNENKLEKKETEEPTTTEEEKLQTPEGVIEVEDGPRAEADGERISDGYFTASPSSTSLVVPDPPDAEEPRAERVSLWRRFKKFMTPKHLRQYKDRPIRR